MCDMHDQTWYVKSHESKCPPTVNLSRCKVLSDYLNNTETYFKNGTVFELLSGQHELTDSLHISGVNNLSPSGYRPTDGQKKCVVKCMTPQGGIRIVDASEISISHIHIVSCNSSWRTTKTDAVNVSLLFHSVSDIVLFGLVVSGCNGHGILASVSHGQVQIHNSCFTGNKKGNVVIDFGNSGDENCNLNITASNFTDGGDESFNDDSVAGGLTVYSQCPGITINIQHACVRGNSGNIKLIMEDFLHHQWSVVVSESELANGNKSEGTGLSLMSKSPRQSCFMWNNSFYNEFKIIKTIISSNWAKRSSAGLLIGINDSNCVSTKIQILECVFNDKISHGAIIKVNNKVMPIHNIIVQTRSQISLISTKLIRNNNLLSSSHGSVMETENIKHLHIENCSFVDNTGTGLSLKSSNVVFKGKVYFLNNSGSNGGALRLCSSSLVFISNNTKGDFSE